MRDNMLPAKFLSDKNNNIIPTRDCMNKPSSDEKNKMPTKILTIRKTPTRNGDFRISFMTLTLSGFLMD
jgi:hypothetical protein